MVETLTLTLSLTKLAHRQLARRFVSSAPIVIINLNVSDTIVTQ